MKKIFLLSFIFVGITCFSQQEDSKVENMKRDFLTSELQLTSQESEGFFPIYNEYSQKRRDVRKSLREEKKSLMNDGESSVDKIIDKEQELVNLQKEYLEKFRKVLPEKKIVLLIEAEKKFKTMMMSKLKR
mgnify:CR=1 FL=1